MRHASPLLLLLVVGCLTSREDYLELLARSTDWDLDGHSPPKHGGDDCDDDNANTWPGADELCDNEDNDCDEVIDEGVQLILYVDEDGDGFGDPERPQGACAEGLGFVLEAGDCDDGDPEIHPGAPEICDNGVDDDCSGDAAGCRWEGELDLYDATSRWVGEGVDDYAGAFQPGDINGDGVDDLLIGAPYADSETGIETGALYGVYGPIPEGTHSLRDADFKIPGPERGALFGSASYFTASDITHDAVVDVLVWDYVVRDQYPEAVVLIFEGPISQNLELEQPDSMIYSNNVDYHLSTGLHRLGDVSGDDAPDIGLEAVERYSFGESTHRFLIVHGPVTRDMDIAQAEASLSPVNDDDEDMLDLVGGGDLNGDGVADLVTSVEFTGGQHSSVLAFFGPIEGAYTTDDFDAEIRGPYQAPDNWWLFSPQIAGDTNGDGHDDVAIGAPFASISAQSGGASYLFLGPLSGSSALGEAEATYVGDVPGGLAGVFHSPGDVDGDELADLLLAHTEELTSEGHVGSMNLYYGPVQGLITSDMADARIGDNAALGGMSFTLAPPHPSDLDDDGLNDIVEPVYDDLGRGGVAIFVGSGL